MDEITVNTTMTGSELVKWFESMTGPATVKTTYVKRNVVSLAITINDVRQLPDKVKSLLREAAPGESA